MSLSLVLPAARRRADDHVDSEKDAKREKQPDGIRDRPAFPENKDNLGDRDDRKKGD
jgi:hypothetical protein